jgi:WD40 repeat protein
VLQAAAATSVPPQAGTVQDHDLAASMSGLEPDTTPYNGHTAAVYALAPGAMGTAFISGGGDGKVIAWDLQRPDEGTLLATVSDAIYSLLLDRERERLLVGTAAGRLHVIDLRSKQETQVVELHRKGIFRILAHHANGFLCAGGDGILSVWDQGDAVALQRQIPLCDEKLRDLALSPTGDRVAVACGDGTVREFEPALFNETLRTEAHPGGANSVSYHPVKPILISGGKDGNLRFRHTHEDGREVHAFPAHKGSVYAAGVDPSGRWLASVGRDALVKLWDANDLQPLYRSARDRSGHTHSANALLWRDGILITASDDKVVRAWTFPR